MLEKYFHSQFLSGEKLVGDEFKQKDIAQWYKEEEEAYCNLTDMVADKRYMYENINNFYGLNVSFVLSQFVKVLKKDGFIFLREPISSMGNWSKVRIGTTINERGISSQYLAKTLSQLDCEIIFKKYCFFNPILKIFNKINLTLNSCIVIYIDFIFLKLFSWNMNYFRDNIFKKIAPGSVFMLSKKK